MTPSWACCWSMVSGSLYVQPRESSYKYREKAPAHLGLLFAAIQTLINNQPIHGHISRFVLILMIYHFSLTH